MASVKFTVNLKKLINKQLKSVILSPPKVTSIGSDDDLRKGLEDNLKSRFIQFGKSEYSDREFLVTSILTEDPNISRFFFATPILNIQNKSVQGIGTFLAVIPHSIPETYVERMATRLSHKLLPHDMVVNQGIKPRNIIKQDMIDYPAVKYINSDKKLCKNLAGHLSREIEAGSISNQVFKIEMDHSELVPGVFTIVPYYGHTIIIAKDAGKEGAKIDAPRYPFKDRFAALSKVASYIAQYPQEGEDVGMFFMDPSLETIITPLLRYIDGE